MSSAAGGRHSGVLRRDGEAIVVLARGGTEVGSWPLAGSRQPDLGLVDEVARLALTARRLDCEIGLRGACPALLGLLDLVGLQGVVADLGPERNS
jgi:hypothetical protein